MDTTISMLIMSVLSDVQELNGMNGQTSTLHLNVNYAKWLVLNYPDTNQEVDADEVYAEFRATPLGQIKIIQTNIC